VAVVSHPGDDEQPGKQPADGGRLAALLADLGVGSQWSIRELERRSVRPLGRETWRLAARRLRPGEVAIDWEPATLETMYDTLRSLGARTTDGRLITLKALTDAARADHGYHVSDDPGAYATLVSSDDVTDVAMTLVQRMTHTERLQFLQDVIAMVAGGEAPESPPPT
jgi:hypothetical protein